MSSYYICLQITHLKNGQIQLGLIVVCCSALFWVYIVLWLVCGSVVISSTKTDVCFIDPYYFHFSKWFQFHEGSFKWLPNNIFQLIVFSYCCLLTFYFNSLLVEKFVSCDLSAKCVVGYLLLRLASKIIFIKIVMEASQCNQNFSVHPLSMYPSITMFGKITIVLLWT